MTVVELAPPHRMLSDTTKSPTEDLLATVSGVLICAKIYDNDG